MKLSIDPLSDTRMWNKSLLDCLQKTFFLNSDLLTRLSPNIKFFTILNGKEQIGIVPLIEGNIHLPHIYYYGLALNKNFYKAKTYNKTENLIKIFSYLSHELYTSKTSTVFTLHSDFTDIRGFSWANFDDPSINIHIVPRYTHIIDIEGASYDNLFNSFRSVRKQEIRYAITRENLKVYRSNNISLLCELYSHVFIRQGVKPTKSDLTAIKIIYEELQKTQLNFDIIEVKNKLGKAVASALVFEDYDKTMHVPIVGTGDTKYGGSLLYSSIIKWGIEHNVKAIDFNGSNSPKRAFFKQSFGGRSQLFFQISKF
jgi:hypothetical protein